MTIPYFASYIVLWILVLIQSAMILALTRAVYRLESIGGPLDSGGTAGLRSRPTPNFSAVDVNGATIKNSDFYGKRTAILFVSSSCPSCVATLDELGALRTKAEGNVIVVSRSQEHEARELAQTYGLDVPVIADEFSTISDLFGITRVPTAVLIGPENRIESQGEPKRGDELAAIFSSPDSEPALT